MHVAVIDDSLATRTILVNMLRECGCQVAEAADRASAVRLLESDPSIRVILIDWHLPDAGGYELTRQFRGNARFIGRRVIMVTNEAHIDDVANALEAGIDDYLTKPFTLSAVREKLDLLNQMAA